MSLFIRCLLGSGKVHIIQLMCMHADCACTGGPFVAKRGDKTRVCRSAHPIVHANMVAKRSVADQGAKA